MKLTKYYVEIMKGGQVVRAFDVDEGDSPDVEMDGNLITWALDGNEHRYIPAADEGIHIVGPPDDEEVF